ncbi:hypothetical protein BKH26_00125 [Actinomyces oris]|uniref:Uncharacterized protein n=2 Tax=Actinomycetaceae TaxID=2049 RepID=A0A1Q8VXD5_9ACTO|nr:hypothetical protein BKH27_07940 [Actinomyces oris]OLO58035.1 hypothetical protein BKH26_00125 [Actinomyces oris]
MIATAPTPWRWSRRSFAWLTGTSRRNWSRTMSSARCPDEPAEYRLTALPGNRAAYVLATWGLVSLLPGATLRFEGEAVPVVGYGWDTDELVDVAARGLVERTWGLGEGGLRGITTTTPRRSAVNVLSHAGWQAADKTSDLRACGPVAVFDASATSAERLKSTGMQDLQVRSSALTLLSGKSHTAKSVQDTWGLMGASLTTADDAVAAGAAHLDRLVHGDLAVARAKPGLRFSASQATPRITSGSEECDVYPLVDLLAFCGHLLLQPQQREMTREYPVKALTWVLHPVPLTMETIIDLHESPPPDLPWRRWTSLIRGTGSTAKVTSFGPAHPGA